MKNYISKSFTLLLKTLMKPLAIVIVSHLYEYVVLTLHLDVVKLKEIRLAMFATDLHIFTTTYRDQAFHCKLCIEVLFDYVLNCCKRQAGKACIIIENFKHRKAIGLWQKHYFHSFSGTKIKKRTFQSTCLQTDHHSCLTVQIK